MADQQQQIPLEPDLPQPPPLDQVIVDFRHHHHCPQVLPGLVLQPFDDCCRIQGYSVPWRHWRVVRLRQGREGKDKSAKSDHLKPKCLILCFHQQKVRNSSMSQSNSFLHWNGPGRPGNPMLPLQQRPIYWITRRTNCSGTHWARTWRVPTPSSPGMVCHSPSTLQS